MTRNSSPRSMDPAEIAELAARSSARTGYVAPRLDDAIEPAVGLADEAARKRPGQQRGLSPARSSPRATRGGCSPGRRRTSGRAAGHRPPATRSPPPSCHERPRHSPGGKGDRQLCGTVLIFEAIVIGLAILPAIVLEHANRGLAGGVGGALAVCAVLIGGVVGRPRMGWALVAGTVLQFLVIAAGVVVPAMYILGVIFAALWVTGIWLARRPHPPPRRPLTPARYSRSYKKK